MEPKQKIEQGLVSPSEKELLVSLAEKFKDKTLFPEMIKEAKEYIRNITVINISDFPEIIKTP